MSKASEHRGAAKVLYLSYDGICDPLGGSQVLPYLFGLAKRGHEISLISFEKPERSRDERAAVERACSEAGVSWHPLPYHKRPPLLSSIYDVQIMGRLAERLHRARHFDLIHCRSYLSALVGLRMKRRFGVPFIFDMRGFWADERVDGRIWNLSNPLFRAVYNYFKKREADFLRDADHIVSLTEAGKAILVERRTPPDVGPPITVIPCCVDFDLFAAINDERRAKARTLLGIDTGDQVLGYIGSLGGNYLLDEMLDFFRTYRERYPSARFLFVTQVQAAIIIAAAAAKGIPASAVVVRPASRPEVPVFMAAANDGIAFKQPSFSARACSPTKLGEMLALEHPVITNAQVGDVERIMAETGAGVVVDGFNKESYRKALDELERLTPDMERWRTAARRWFDLETAIERYNAIYESVVATGGERQGHA